ncbi:cytochrome c oxidase, subunit II [Marinomonas sp. MED121]|uniref:cytochrome c oxidase subunit II n=1 Tax=Marinomonas sp. MED121 TaxID=314277 RepID=UPI000069085B|nr:cytochrome c oxidase subunit II [Marinomonas sp. MED121]EAQ64493.1 cytochrome c oxidase, subunit II [Marinomonas sp. MED121]
MKERSCSSAVLIILAALWSVSAQADWALNMTEGVTEVSRSIYSLHMQIFWICVVIAIAVFSVMFWSIIHHRKSVGAKAEQFHENTTVELIWTIVPVLILVAMAVPATTTLIEMYDTSDSDVDIQVTGYQWKWQYQYLGEDLSFFSNLSTNPDEINNKVEKNKNYLLEVDEPLVVPIGKKIRFLVTSNDVIHSWWVPAFAVKRDAIPGFINESWTRIDEVGTYRGQCAELCGKDHGFMPIVVQAVTDEDYALWLTEKKASIAAEVAAAARVWSLEELMVRGEQVYQKNCAACHQVGGQGISPMFPALKASAIATQAEQRDAHIKIVLEGRAGTAMQAYGAQLSAVELAAVITYERNAWGNDTGDIITPQSIQSMLKSK